LSREKTSTKTKRREQDETTWYKQKEKARNHNEPGKVAYLSLRVEKKGGNRRKKELRPSTW